jgi:hypothetical protein
VALLGDLETGGALLLEVGWGKLMDCVVRPQPGTLSQKMKR